MSEKLTTELSEHEKKIELLEERAVVNKEKITTAKLHVSKVIKQKTVNVPVTLTEEVLIIDTKYPDHLPETTFHEKNDDAIVFEDNIDTSNTQIVVNGKTVSLGDLPHEITISREVAKVVKETYAVEEVTIDSQTKTKQGNIQIDLRHEELEIDNLKK